MALPDAVACPKCGWLQSSMVRFVRARRFKVGLLATIVLSAVVLAGGMIWATIHDQFSPVIEAAVAILCIGLAGSGWHAIRDPNDVAGEVDRKTRASQSRGLTIEEHQHRQREAAEQRVANEAAFAEAIASESSMEESPEQMRGGFPSQVGASLSVGREGRAALNASRQRRERAVQQQRRKRLQIVAVVVGAVLGAIVDAFLRHIDFDTLTLRMIATLFLGAIGGILANTVVWRMGDFTPADKASTAKSAANVAMLATFLFAAAPAAFAVAGMELATKYDYAIVVICQSAAFALVTYTTRSGEEPA